MQFDTRKLILCCFFNFTYTFLCAQYAISDIPAGLTNNADIVIRRYEEKINIKSKGSATIETHYVYTILNAAADEYADFYGSYDKLIKISGIEGNLYNAEGTKVRSLKKNELKDYSNTGESELADDNRVKHHSFNYRQYPYTVEYKNKVELDGLFYLPTWMPVIGENAALENSTLTVTTPADYVLRFKSLNNAGEPVKSTTKSAIEYKWELNKLAAIRKEIYAPGWHEITPTVFLAPSSFEMQRYAGRMDNWSDFSAFMYKLNAGRDELPAHIKQKVHELTDAISDPRDKIAILYKYLQQNTRYISIQLGIGGWQTLDANFVASNGYGDCKALTNYMYALLKEAGIKSYPSLIYAGSGKRLKNSDFPSNQFNHVVLCVPQQKDSIWLECTSKSDEPGYMGSFTGNRQALLIDEKDGMLVTTPSYKAQDNLQVRNIVAILEENGLLKATVNTHYAAMQQDRLDGLLHTSSNDQLKEYMRNKFSLSSYEIEKYAHTRLKNKLPAIEEKITLTVKDFATVTGKRLFINPNVLSISSFKIKENNARKFDFDITIPFTDVDTVHIAIPAGYKPESIPANSSIELPWAKFTANITLERGKIIYTRYYKQLAVRIPATRTKELSDFFDKIYKADHSKIVFIKEPQN